MTAALFDRARAFCAEPHRLLIGGAWVEAQSGQRFDGEDPATGARLGSFAAADRADADRAAAAARQALDTGPWPRLTPAERGRMLWRLAALVQDHADLLSAIETLDIGKPLAQVRGLDVAFAIELLEYNAGWPARLAGEAPPLSNPGTWHAYTRREPVGVAGLIVPWNAPLMMAVAKLAPALAAGCTVILKPAEQSPLSALYLGRLVAEAGIPPGVVNILTGFGATAGAALAAHPGIDKISFTGSAETGRRIVQAALGNFKRVTLELGGKTPVIVFPDADPDRAAAAAARSIFSNSGQVCNAGSRLYVHRRIFDRVLADVAARAEALRIGPGTDPDSDMGPVISAPQLDRITGYVETGRAEGASVLTGGTRLDRAGHFLRPTILTGTGLQMRVAREEIFGPVLCAMPFDTDDLGTLAAEANGTAYGLGAQIWTRDLGIAHGLAARIKAGTVRVNGSGLDPALPFGGFGASGWGREYGREGVEAYTEVKSVAIALPGP